MHAPKHSFELPPMNPQERADLEAEADRKFISDEQAYRYLLRRTQSAAFENALSHTWIDIDTEEK